MRTLRPDLSILICSLECRTGYLGRLLACLEPQRHPSVEILVNTDNGAMTVGEKRNRLLKDSKGFRICFIDDDDLVAPNYVSTILDALSPTTDAVGFKVLRMVDGKPQGVAVHNSCYRTYDDYEENGKTIFTRPINHLNPVLRETALNIGFPNINEGEDKAYAMELCGGARGWNRIRRCVFVPRILYIYDYRSPMKRQHETVNQLAMV